MPCAKRAPGGLKRFRCGADGIVHSTKQSSRRPIMTMNEKQKALCEGHGLDFSDLKALFVNCTLKPSREFSHTGALMDVSKSIMEANGVSAEMLRPADFTLPQGVYPDMREHG